LEGRRHLLILRQEIKYVRIIKYRQNDAIELTSIFSSVPDILDTLYKDYANAKKKVQILESGGSVDQQFAKPDAPPKPAPGSQSPTRYIARKKDQTLPFYFM
jgi:hypothetical protein